MSDERRLAVLRITPEFLVGILQPWSRDVRWMQIVDNPLPADARVLNVHNDFGTQEVSIVLESETFAPVNPGELVPILPDVIFRALYDDDGERERPPGPAV